MRRAKIALLCVVVPGLLFSGNAFCVDRASYRYVAPIQGVSPGYVLFNIPPQVYDKANPSLSDVRIVTGEGEEVPYVIWSNTKTAERKKIETGTLNTSYIPQSYTTFTLDIGETGIRTNSLTVTTKSVDFVRRVTVEGSPDNKTFAVLKRDDYIFDLTSEHNIKNLAVSYPTTDYRYLKVTIWDDGEEPLVDPGGEIYLVSEIRGESAVLISSMKREEKASSHTTEITLDLSYRNLPSSSAELSVDDKSFKREVKILSSNEDDPAKYIESFSTTIYRITTPRFVRSSSLIEYPEIRARYVKIIVQNENDRPLLITNVAVSGVPRKITFTSDPRKEYFLYFGNPNSKNPSYDIEELFSYIDKETVAPVTLGAVTANPGYIPGAELPFTERYPFLLWGAIILMIALLGGIVIRMMMKITKESKE